VTVSVSVQFSQWSGKHCANYEPETGDAWCNLVIGKAVWVKKRITMTWRNVEKCVWPKGLSPQAFAKRAARMLAKYVKTRRPKQKKIRGRGGRARKTER
jgi:hypothetical protein